MTTTKCRIIYFTKYLISNLPIDAKSKLNYETSGKSALQQRIRFSIVFFMCALAVSGLTAIPLQWELKLLMPIIAKAHEFGINFPALSQWIARVNDGVQNGYGQYPFLAYGTDWLAFGHVAIAFAFVGPLRDPIKNIWVIEFGMIACLLVIP